MSKRMEEMELQLRKKESELDLKIITSVVKDTIAQK